MRSSLISRMRLVRELVDEHGAIDRVAAIERRDVVHGDDAPAGRAIENALDEPGSFLALVTDGGHDFRQYIADIRAIEPVGVVAEPVADEERPDAILERQPARENPLHDGSRRQLLADRDR